MICGVKIIIMLLMRFKLAVLDWSFIFSGSCLSRSVSPSFASLLVSHHVATPGTLRERRNTRQTTEESEECGAARGVAGKGEGSEERDRRERPSE